LWGDVVQFARYDAYGRNKQQYLPYTTATESGKLKTTTFAEQEAYYQTNYQETNAFAQTQFDNSPLNRALNSKSPGTSWSASAGNSRSYELNEAADPVRILQIGYEDNAMPQSTGVYAANTLFRNRYIDENSKQVVEYLNQQGQLILKKDPVCR
jgi:hypothetical protein